MALLVLVHFQLQPRRHVRRGGAHPSGSTTAIMKSMAPIGSTPNPIEAISLGLYLDVRHRRLAAHPDGVLHRDGTPRRRVSFRCSTRTCLIGHTSTS